MESALREVGMILEPAMGWLDFADDSELFPHESAFGVSDACDSARFGVVAGWAESDARKSARYDIHQSAPRLPVKCNDVVPDRKWLNASVILSRHEYAAGVVVKLDGADDIPSEQLAREYAATMTREKCQLIHDPLLLVFIIRECALFAGGGCRCFSGLV